MSDIEAYPARRVGIRSAGFLPDGVVERQLGRSESQGTVANNLVGSFGKTAFSAILAMASWIVLQSLGPSGSG
ncbi:hypothetical protein SBA1_1470015 [Candidatus Sulfotelmatobacter kueseliae]|uniref:Uncharacterized protein n=1 Tax=Candidatus Sulfotelmatobacter kueseliae TaxID=2042962 RepID=A0A2U3K8A2_9BACT|nr:hypothetical protein SBA1_1470015 [Candidatus Sulfotelmatobacter kueseliae]